MKKPKRRKARAVKKWKPRVWEQYALILNGHYLETVCGSKRDALAAVPVGSWNYEVVLLRLTEIRPRRRK